MATIPVTFQIEETAMQDYIDGYCAKYDYANTAQDGETEAQFAKRWAAVAIKAPAIEGLEMLEKATLQETADTEWAAAQGRIKAKSDALVID